MSASSERVSSGPPLALRRLALGISGNTTTNNSFAQTLTFTNTNWEQKSLMLTIPTSLSWVAVYMTSTTPECLFDDLALGQNLGGLSATYFDNVDLTGPQATRVDPSINLNWGTAAPIAGIAPTTYSVRWTGQIAAPTTGTHTFYLTHTDGARLMVNGQVLVNNWKDQASLTDSAAITLQANVRYDVRLEYYRNSTNPGQIRLEWQSSYLTRQDVFSDRLFSSGSNAQDVLLALSSYPNFPVNVQFQLSDTAAHQSGTGRTFVGVSTDKKTILLGVFYEGRVSTLQRVDLSGNQGNFIDVITGRSVSLGDMTQYFNPDGTTDQNKLNSLLAKTLPATNPYDSSVEGGVFSNSVGTQGLLASICEDYFKPTNPCGATCGPVTDRYQRDECTVRENASLVLIGATFGALGLIPGGQLPLAILIAKAGGLLFGGGVAAYGLADLWKSYDDKVKSEVDWLACTNLCRIRLGTCRIWFTGIQWGNVWSYDTGQILIPGFQTQGAAISACLSTWSSMQNGAAVFLGGGRAVGGTTVIYDVYKLQP